MRTSCGALLRDCGRRGIRRSITLSAGIVEAVAKPDYESEDIVTDLINRAEYSAGRGAQSGAESTIVVLESPKV